MKAYTLLLVGIWIGLVIGLSFVEAPLKFQAPGITTKLGLGIGRLVFDYSNKIQLAFLSILFIVMFLNYNAISNMASILTSLLVLILCLQSLYLLPTLDARATEILNNQSVPDSLHHLYFVALEILKLSALFILFINLYNKWRI